MVVARSNRSRMASSLASNRNRIVVVTTVVTLAVPVRILNTLLYHTGALVAVW